MIIIPNLAVAQTGNGSDTGRHLLLDTANCKNLITGQCAIAFGYGSSASGRFSIAMGAQSSASNFASIAMGASAQSSGYASIALGNNVISNGIGSVVIGQYASSGGFKGTFVFSDGLNSQMTTASADNQVLIKATGGFNLSTNLSTTSGLFIDTQGKVGIGKNDPASTLDVNGAIAINGAEVISSDLKWKGDTTGLVGQRGPQGPQGPAGTNGATWLSGTTNPASSIGGDGDFYLNTVTDSAYEKTSGNWAFSTLIKGDRGTQGPSGTNGATWLSGTTNPTSAAGKNGDFYLNTATDSVFTKSGTVWNFSADLKGNQGSQGPKGDAGSSWYSGTSDPAASLGSNGDFFLNSATDSVFLKNSNSWNFNTFLKGSKGDTGPRGSTGPQGPKGPKGDEGSCSCSAAAIAAAAAAGVSATAAAASATEATGAATGAAASAAEATASAGEATTAAGEASTSATEATESATKASESATEASASQKQAKISADSAKISKSNASNYAQQAKVYQDTAKAAASRAQRAANTPLGGDLSGKIANANVLKIQNQPVSSLAPEKNQLLQWDGTQWKASSVDSVEFVAGRGIRLNKDTIGALTDSAFWNASQLRSRSISEKSPEKQDALIWDGKEWTPSASIWSSDSVDGKPIIYVENQAAVGINTKTPSGLFEVKGGTATSDSSVVIGKNGHLSIKTSKVDTTFALVVNGEMLAKGFTVESNWADYVFEKNYELMSLDKLAEFISQEGHLPNIPKAETVEKNGLNVGVMQVKMMEKIEELTLYMLQLNEENKLLREELDQLKIKLADED